MGAWLNRGVTLVELLVVTTILGIVAVATIPFLTSVNPQQLDTAANQFAEAIRFARDEAIRSSKPLGFQTSLSSNGIDVFSANTSTTPWALNFDVYHPVSKQLYTFDADTHPLADVETMISTPLFQGACNTPVNIVFDAGGRAWCADPESTLLRQLTITLTLGNHSRLVTLLGITGRVTVQ